jgi:indolepyruvate ferredoxin oxidoreductase beta subunit
VAPDFLPEGELANRRSLNVALLGALSHHLHIPEEAFLAALKAALPERLHAVNEQAFAAGRARAASAGAAAPDGSAAVGR